jgi:hypothetical protein
MMPITAKEVNPMVAAIDISMCHLLEMVFEGLYSREIPGRQGPGIPGPCRPREHHFFIDSSYAFACDHPLIAGE